MVRLEREEGDPSPDPGGWLHGGLPRTVIPTTTGGPRWFPDLEGDDAWSGLAGSLEIPEEKAPRGVFCGEVSSLLLSLCVWTIAQLGTLVLDQGWGWCCGGGGAGVSPILRCDWAQFPPQLSTSIGASGLRKNLVPPAFWPGPVFLHPSDLKAARAWTAPRHWMEISQLS